MPEPDGPIPPEGPEPEQPLPGSSYPAYPDYAPDLTELILLAGDADKDLRVTKDTLEGLGWERGVVLVDRLVVDSRFRDHARTYRKGPHCIAAFSGLNDPQDEVEAFMGVSGDQLVLERRCGFDVHLGVALQLDGYTYGRSWQDFLNYFNRRECRRVSAVGHSLGGSVATLFAACANAGHFGEGVRSDFGLVTFGAFPVSPRPLYSGTPGTPFRGTRYHVSGPSSGASVRDSLPADSRALRLEILRFFGRVAALYNLPGPSRQMARASALIARSPPEEVENVWSGQRVFTDMIRPLWPALQMVHSGSGPTSEFLSLQPVLRELVRNITARGEATFLYDPVSAWGAAYGYKHALVDYQPISNPLTREAIGFRRVAAARAVALPRVDPLVTQMGSMLSGPKIPNHGNCCYYRGADCINKYEVGFTRLAKACGVSVFR